MPPLTLINGTYLTLTPTDGTAPTLTPYAARGLTQTLELLTGSGAQNSTWLRRDINGNLISLADTRFRKYKSTVTCQDGETPCLDASWIGNKVTVACVQELSYPTGGTPARTAVAGSTRTQGAVTYYRPTLTMLVLAIKSSLPEYSSVYSWQIDLEEV